LPSFVAVVIASLCAWMLSDFLAPYGPAPPRALASFILWMVVFSLARRSLESLRP
jgi:hypothetical protein